MSGPFGAGPPHHAGMYLPLTGGTLTGAVLFDFGTLALPGIAFAGDPDLGLFRIGANQMVVSVGNKQAALFLQAGGSGILAGALNQGYALINRVASATVPTICSDPSDLDTGLGRAAANKLSLIAGGVETLRVETDRAALGTGVATKDAGEFAFASGNFAANGDAQTSVYTLRNSTTDGAQTELFTDGSAADISVPSDGTLFFRASIAARRTDADDESAAFIVEGCIDNNAGTTALVGSVSNTVVARDNAAWSVDVTADNANDSINVLVTGEAAKTIRWVARVEITEVNG